MADDMNAQDNQGALKLFGFEIKRTKKEKTKELPSVVPPSDQDGAGYVTAAGHYFGHYIDIDGSNSKDNAELIRKYRGISYHPEVDTAIEEIVNEAIVTSEKKSCVNLNTDEIAASANIKKKLTEEFEHIVGLLDFNENGHDIFRTWYVDGRLYHHLVTDPSNTQLGVQDIRFMDSTKIRKIKDIKYNKESSSGVKTVKSVQEFFIFEDRSNARGVPSAGVASGVKLTPDSVSYVTSGLLDENRKKVVSHLHKVLKPVNQLRMMEDSLVIYRLARAPERRIFYIDVGNMATGKAEQYIKNMMSRYRNKLVYDASTGQMKDDRKHMSMLEDYWLPRREGTRGTEISTLPGGDNLGQIDDIVYFQKRVYKALNVPFGRLDQESQFSLGRTNEITRDEVKFQKFIDRLRCRFAKLFLETLKRHCILKGICTEEDWTKWKNDIKVDFLRDNHFNELKESEVHREKAATIDAIDQYVGKYYSREWVMKNILNMSDEELKDMIKEIDQEESAGEYRDDEPDEPTEPAPAPATVVDTTKEPENPKKTSDKKIANDK